MNGDVNTGPVTKVIWRCKLMLDVDAGFGPAYYLAQHDF